MNEFTLSSSPLARTHALQVMMKADYERKRAAAVGGAGPSTSGGGAKRARSSDNSNHNHSSHQSNHRSSHGHGGSAAAPRQVRAGSGTGTGGQQQQLAAEKVEDAERVSELEEQLRAEKEQISNMFMKLTQVCVRRGVDGGEGRLVLCWLDLSLLITGVD